MSDINLIPADRIEERAARKRLRTWVVRLAVITVVGGVTLIAGLRHVSARNSRAAALEAEFALRRDRVALAERVLDTRDRFVERRRAITAVRVRPPVVSTLDTFGHALPARASLTYLRLATPVEDEDESSPPHVVVKGHASDHTEVGTLLRRLEHADEFDDVQLVRMTEHTGGARSRVEFEVSARFATGEAG